MVRKVDPRQQFSKKLARWTAVFWFLYMAWLSVLLYLVPESALYSVYMAIIVSVVMIINIYHYTSNSKLEKMLFAMIEKTELELKIGNSKISKSNDSEEEGGDNG